VSAENGPSTSKYNVNDEDMPSLDSVDSAVNYIVPCPLVGSVCKCLTFNK
jgi:hypothetical protein